jgi:asparagine synthetase B (glutamine-hydrolysing)
VYYCREGNAVLISSDLETLLGLVSRGVRLAQEEITSSFFCGAVYGGATLLSGVRRALPGTTLHVTSRTTAETAAPPLAESGEALSEQSRLACELDRRLRDSVGRLAGISKQPLVLMSGGIDSPLVAAYLKQRAGELSTLTLAMPTPPDETERAASITQWLGGTHHVSRCDFTETDVLADLSGFVRAMEEPTSFGLGLMMMTMARQARTLSKAYLCGVGADVLFGLPYHPANDPRVESIYHYLLPELVPERVSEVVNLTGYHPDETVARLRARLSDPPGHASIRLGLWLQTGLMIRCAARLARFHHVEALFPYLDRDVVRLALDMPPGLHALGKPVLSVLAGRVFALHAPAGGKVPFTAYPVKWLQSAGRLNVLLDLLDEQRTRERGVFKRRGLRRLVDRGRAGQADKSWHLVLWQVVVFELFCRQFVDGRPRAGVGTD